MQATPNGHEHNTGPAPRAAHTTPADEALARLLDQDPAIKRAKLQHNIAKVIVQMVTGLPKLSAPHCAEAMDPDQWQDVLDAYDAMGAWIDQVRVLRGRGTLKLVR